MSMNERQKRREQEIEEVRTAVGITAEMSLMYFRAIIGAGATIEEAMRLTQAYIAAILYGNKKDPEENAP